MSKTILLKPTMGYAIIASFTNICITILFFAVGLIMEKYLNNYYDVVKILKYFSIIPLAITVYKIIYWRMVNYEISSSQIKYLRGVFNLEEDYLELFRIKDLKKDQPFILRIFNLMNIIITSSDKSHPQLILNGVPFSNITDVLRELILESRKLNKVFEVD